MTENNGYLHQIALLVNIISTIEEKALLNVKKAQFRENMRTYPPWKVFTVIIDVTVHITVSFSYYIDSGHSGLLRV